MPAFHSEADSAKAVQDAASNHGELRFLSGGGEVGQRLRSGKDLPASVQTPAVWPDSIKALVAVMFSANQPMFVAWGAERHMVYNDFYRPILRGKHPSALGQPLLEVWHEIYDELQPLVEKAFAGEATQCDKLEFQVEREGRLQPAWFSFFYAPVRDASGDVVGMFCACNEITEQQLAKQAATATSERYKSVIDAMSEGFVLMDKDYRVLEMNAEALRLDGREPCDLVGRTHWELWPGSLGTPVEAAYREAMQQRRPVSLSHHYTSEGYDNWLELRIYPVAEGGAAAFFRNVNKPKRAEAALCTSEARFRAAVSVIGVMWTNNSSGEMVGDQPGWSQITGQSADQYHGFGWTKAVHPDDVQPTVDAWQQAVASGSVFRHEHRLRVQTGQWRLFSIRAVPVFDANQQISEWVGVHVDITEARRAEETLREADQRKDEFLATLAHELRNPLAPIRNAAHVLSQADVTPSSVRSCADILARQVGHMALLLDDLLDVSRITSGRLALKKTIVMLSAIVDPAVEAARPGIAARGHHLVVSVPDELIQVNADSLRLSQVLTNLLNNAAKYTDPNGQIALTVTSTGDGLQLAVSDNGIGLAPDSLARIFIMFSQVNSPIDRSEGGVGIGLSLARGLVELHGGTLEAQSPGLGHGTTVTVRLPASIHAGRSIGLGALAATTVAFKPTAPGLSILVVDDNRDAADTLSMLLEMEGHHTATAYNGVSALALIDTRAFDAGIMDIGMPGMSGYELARQTRAMAAGKNLLLIALTGWGQESDQQKALAAGFDRQINKPVNPNQLLEGLNSWVARKRAGNTMPEGYSVSAFSNL